MLKSHVDIEVLVDALKKYHDGPINRLGDFIDLVNKNSQVVLYGDPKDDELNLLSILLEGRGETLITRESKESCSKAEAEIKNPFQVYFASGDNFPLEIIENFFTASKNDYEEKFNQLKGETYLRVGDKKSGKSFKNWDDLSPNVFFSDVILVDPFILNNNTGAELEHNLFDMLRVLRSIKTIDNFIIFTKYPGIGNTPINIDEIRKKCIDILGPKTKVGIVYFGKEIKEHDRYLFMNYQFLISGNSFSSFFDSEGILRSSNASAIRTYSLINPHNFEQMQDVLDRLKKSLDALHSKKEALKHITSRLFNYSS